MSNIGSTTRLAYILTGAGLLGIVALVAINRIGGVSFEYPLVLGGLVVAMTPAAGIALLFHTAALERAGPPPPPK